jgi:hypothetical protein
MQITFDDVSLIVQQIIYHNATPQPGALMLVGPVNHTYPCPANSDQTVDMTGDHIVMVKSTGVGKFGPYTSYSLPGGEQVSFQWPA